MLDGDENIQSYVCNENNLKLFDASKYVKIIFTSISYNNASKNDYKYVIWHLASEKLRGLSLLFYDIKNNNSQFWSLQSDDIKYFLGKYVGIDKMGAPKNQKTPQKKVCDFDLYLHSALNERNFPRPRRVGAYGGGGLSPAPRGPCRGGIGATSGAPDPTFRP